MFPCMAVAPIHIEGFALEAAVVRCRIAAGLKHEVLAVLMGISSQQLSQQLARRGGYLSLPRVLSVAKDPDGRRFLRLLWTEVADFIGIEDHDAVALQLAELRGRVATVLDKVQIRMLRVELVPQHPRRKEMAS